METIKVVASRYWGNPVELKVNDEMVSVSVSMTDFLNAFFKELGSVTWTIRDATFQARVNTAVTSVMEKFKQESEIKEISSKIPMR